MLDRNVPVYSGDNFEVCTQYLMHTFKEHWEAGHIVERKMPWPAKKKPDRTRTVYFWTGIPDTQVRLKDISSEMPPMVTEMAAAGSRMHKAFAYAYRGIMMGNASRPIVVPA